MLHILIWLNKLKVHWGVLHGANQVEGTCCVGCAIPLLKTRYHVLHVTNFTIIAGSFLP